MRININFPPRTITVSRVIRYFVLADLLFLGGWGFINPLLGIFILERIANANLIVVGVAVAIYWLWKSLLQIPVAIALDHHTGEKDDFYVLIVSLMLGGFAALLFIAVHTAGELFAVTFLQGTAFALYIPSWSAMFSRHLDEEHFAFDWSLDNAVSGVAIGAAAFASGAVAKFIGFDAVFIMASLFSFVGAAVLLLVPDLVLPRGTTRNLFRRTRAAAGLPK